MTRYLWNLYPTLYQLSYYIIIKQNNFNCWHLIHPLLLKSLLYFLGELPYLLYEKKMFISTGNRTKPPIKLNRLLCRLSYFGIINSYRNTVFISDIGDHIYFSYMTIYTNTAYTTYQMCGLGVIRTAVIFLANLTAR